MSILIKGLKMPKKGTCIDIVILDDGTVVCYDDDKKIGEAVELPDHGDLVDRDKLMMKMWEASAYAPNHCTWVNSRVVFAKDIEDAPVVISAERSEDERKEENKRASHTKENDLH